MIGRLLDTDQDTDDEVPPTDDELEVLENFEAEILRKANGKKHEEADATETGAKKAGALADQNEEDEE